MPWQSPSPCWAELLRDRERQMCCTPQPEWASFFNVNCNNTGSWVGLQPLLLGRLYLLPVCTALSSLLAGPPPLQGNKRAQGGATGLFTCPEQKGKGLQESSPKPIWTVFHIHTQEPGSLDPEPNWPVSNTAILPLTFVRRGVSSVAFLFIPTLTGEDFTASFSPGFMGEGFGIGLLPAG